MNICYVILTVGSSHISNLLNKERASKHIVMTFSKQCILGPLSSSSRLSRLTKRDKTAQAV